MSINMNLWKIEGDELKDIKQTKLDFETRLESWIEKDSSIVDTDILIIGRQVITDHGGRIDLLGIDQQGNLIILELKRDKTPRDVVAQILDYASWVKDLTDERIYAIASEYLKKNLEDYFGDSIPEKLNTTRRMIIVASILDNSSERIVRYLVEEYKVNINVVFFNYFKTETEELLGRAWLKDPDEVREISDGIKSPWTGFWFFNVGEGEYRNWDDNVRYEYIGAGQGIRFPRYLKQLKVGNKFYAYMKGLGYVGFGEVVKEAEMIRNFIVESEQKPLLDLPLKASKAGEDKDDPDMSEWVVGVKWIKTFPREQAKNFSGAFANPNVVCKLRHQETLEFLKKEFELKGVI